MSRPRILVVDDDAAIRGALARILQLRFDVVSAESGAAAVALVEKSERFDVMLTDVEMPVMDGRALVERLRDIEPELAKRVLVMTGGPPAGSRLAAWVDELPRERLLEKPIVTATLLGALDALLHDRG